MTLRYKWLVNLNSPLTSKFLTNYWLKRQRRGRQTQMSRCSYSRSSKTNIVTVTSSGLQFSVAGYQRPHFIWIFGPNPDLKSNSVIRRKRNVKWSIRFLPNIYQSINISLCCFICMTLFAFFLTLPPPLCHSWCAGHRKHHNSMCLKASGMNYNGAACAHLFSDMRMDP